MAASLVCRLSNSAGSRRWTIRLDGAVDIAWRVVLSTNRVLEERGALRRRLDHGRNASLELCLESLVVSSLRRR